MATVLVLPGDVRWNLGDTAILAGVLALVRSVRPDARFVVWAQPPLLREGFEGVRFHAHPGPGLWRDLRRADLVLWGGGQLLQGNRSRVKVPYWAARLGLVRAAGRPIVAVAQGVGPLPAVLDRRLAAGLARRVVSFGVRDADSWRVLRDAGAPEDRLLLAADPALLVGTVGTPLPAPARPSGARPRLGLSLRWTAHHRPGRLVPYQMLPPSMRRTALDTDAFRRFVDEAIRFADRVVDDLDVDLRLIPMYLAPWETDVLLAERILAGVGRPDRVVIVKPRRSLAELFDALRALDACVAVPMHATILAASQGVPTLGVPYEPKGRAWMERLGDAGAYLPLADVLRDGGGARLLDATRGLWEDRDRVRRALGRIIPKLRDEAMRSASPVRSVLDGTRPG